ncbi:MAG: hypothetical protein KC613_26320, partial [Myxococcales bacterium]|nr:hypothetical protein [Myxococcales bacterium]
AYSVGVPAALAAWRRLLAPAGWLVLSELCWREGARSAEAAAFWQREYPDMGDVTQLEARCAAAGYAVRGGFWLPDDAWAAYYGPLEAAVPAVRARHPQAEAQAALDDIGREIALWRRFGGEFGYRFVVAQRG